MVTASPDVSWPGEVTTVSLDRSEGIWRSSPTQEEQILESFRGVVELRTVWEFTCGLVWPRAGSSLEKAQGRKPNLETEILPPSKLAE